MFNNFFPKLITVAILLALWQGLAMAGLINELLLPAPSTLLRQAGNMLQTGELLDHVWASSQRVVVGFAIATVAGVSLGVLLGMVRRLDRYLTIVVELLRPIPPIAWIPLAILWFGIGDSPAYFIVSLGAFFPIFVNSLAGVQSVNPVYVLAGRCLGAGRWLLLTDVILPAGLPHIMTGLRVGIGVAWTSVIAAELVGAQSGLGYMIQLNRILLHTDKIVVGMLTIGLIGLLINQLIVLLERRLLRWQADKAYGV